MSIKEQIEKITHKLKKCPFCDGNPAISYRADTSANQFYFTVWCKLCGIQYNSCLTVFEAWTKWNTRCGIPDYKLCQNSGDQNSGDQNSGDQNSGDQNSGDQNSGDQNSGDQNSGDQNSGDQNSGHSNSGRRNSFIRNYK